MSDTINLQTPEVYRAARDQVYPSPESFRWFCRQHRDELVQAGAMVRPTGRWLVNPTHFDQVVHAVGMRRAGAR